MGRATRIFEHVHQTDASVEDATKLHICRKWPFDHFMNSRAKLVLVVVISRTIKLSRREVFELVKKTTLRLKIAGSRTINRKALRLVVISKDNLEAQICVLVGFRMMSAGMFTCSYFNVLAYSSFYFV